MSTDNESASLDLHGALREAFAEQAAREKTETAATAEALATPTETKGQEVPEAKVAAPETASGEAEAKTQPEPETAIEPPSHWSDKHKELFRSKDADTQKFLLERHKDMEGDYTRKTTEIADQRKAYEELQSALAPYKQIIAAKGIKEIDAIRQLLEVQRRLDTSPKETIELIAKSYGVSLAAPVNDADPDTAGLRAELDSIKQSIALRDRQAADAQQASLQQTLREFQEAKTEKNEPKHPHFEKVRGVMGALIQSGSAKDLSDAYQQAVYANPELRADLLKAESEATKAKVLADAAKHAEEAKRKAIPTGKGAVTQASEKEPKSLREQLRAEYRATLTGKSTRI